MTSTVSSHTNKLKQKTKNKKPMGYIYMDSNLIKNNRENELKFGFLNTMEAKKRPFVKKLETKSQKI